MRGALAAFVILATAGSALAQQGRPAPVDLSVCQTLTRHRPAPDVEYKPGVDVQGRPVAPADLPGSSATAIDRFDIPVSGEFARMMRLHPAENRDSVQIGWLTLEAGQLFFNGRPLGGPAEAQLYAYCRGR